MISKILGLILLLLGVAIILYTLYFSFNVFTAKAAPPEIFKLESQAASSGAQGLEAQFQEIVSEQLRGLIPVDSITTLLNLITWSIFAGILIFAGAQIAGLGVKLIK
jgi:hypothetical protein